MNESIESKIAKATLNNYEKINEIDSYFHLDDKLVPAKSIKVIRFESC